MPGHGPLPKSPAKRRRKNADPIAPRKLVPDAELRGPDLPDDALPDPEPWHPRTVGWWQTWRRSAQAREFPETDWDFLIDTALIHHTMGTKGRWDFASELRLLAAKFGATVEDRARLRMTSRSLTTKPRPAGRGRKRRT
ncbi:phage terminase small subunit [Embleya hyalina]|uniref:Terminase small subunit n=1 Tax=Embleya hyalina TaxID=516124 RepID=A0A401YID8_9ACTN|nr:hypothetical protein [Embleya hyalina]GCD94374.1 hypothetical protein EHYA_02035 [Embleya hyalina]